MSILVSFFTLSFRVAVTNVTVIICIDFQSLHNEDLYGGAIGLAAIDSCISVAAQWTFLESAVLFNFLL